MKRRSFFKILFGTVATAFIAPRLITAPNFEKPKESPRAKFNRERANMISQALDTPEGRIALAQSMCEPIRRSLQYQAIGRKLLMVEVLPV